MLTRTDYFGYQRSSLRSDVIAGLTVWAVLVPESLAYATIAGVSPVVDCCNDVGRRLAVQGARPLSTPRPLTEPGTWVGQQHAEPQQRHRAERDPEEERFANE